jgi:Family of unknown function (DUF6460)
MGNHTVIPAQAGSCPAIGQSLISPRFQDLAHGRNRWPDGFRPSWRQETRHLRPLPVVLSPSQTPERRRLGAFAMERWFGGNPLAVALRLAIYSIVVGIILATLGLSPFALIDSVRIFMIRIYHMGFDAFGWALQYFLLGAVIVIPIWLIRRAMVVTRKSGDQ